MEPASLNQRLSVLKGLHLSFILALLVSGIAGTCLFGIIVNQRIRTCPTIYPVYITFWLCLGLSVLQLLLALCFLCWFLISVYRNQWRMFAGSRQTKAPAATECQSSRAVPEAIGRSGASLTRTNPGVDIDPSTYRAMSESLRELRTNRSGRPIGSWFCVGGIFFAIISAGLILSLVLTQTHISYFYSRFTDELISVFVEARVNFQSTTPQSFFKPNNAFTCWTQAQEDLGCCGLDQYSDWSNQTRIQGPRFPVTCYCRSGCTSRPADQITLVEGRLVYAIGCKKLLQDTLLFKLSATRIYLAVALSILIITFLLDLAFTVLTAHVTLVRSRKRAQFEQQNQSSHGISPVNSQSHFSRPSSAINRSTRAQM